MTNSVLIIDNDLGENLQYMLQNEGVTVYWQQPNLYQQEQQEGPYFLGKGLENFIFNSNGKIIKVGPNWFDYIDKVDYIVFTDVGMNVDQDQLRKDGYLVFNGGQQQDLEIKRSSLKEIYKKQGQNTIPRYWLFDNSDDQQKFVKEKQIGVVFKTDTELQHSEKYKTRVLKDPDQQYYYLKQLGIEGVDIILEEYINGYEIQIGGFFNGNDFVSPLNYNVEDKTLMSWPNSQLTGEMGTLVWYYDKDTRFYKEILQPVVPYLRKINYVGYFDINQMYDPENDRLYQLEQTQRFGYPLQLIQQQLHKIGWYELLFRVLKGEQIIDYQYTGFPIQHNIQEFEEQIDEETKNMINQTKNYIQVGVNSNSEGYPYESILEKSQHCLIQGLKEYIKKTFPNVINKNKGFCDLVQMNRQNKQLQYLFGVYFDEDDKVFRQTPMSGRLITWVGISDRGIVEEQTNNQVKERMDSKIYISNEVIRTDIQITKTKDYDWNLIHGRLFNG